MGRRVGCAYTHVVPAATAQVRNGRGCDVGSDQGVPGRERRSVHVRGQAPDTRGSPHTTQPAGGEKLYEACSPAHGGERREKYAAGDTGLGAWSQSPLAENPGLRSDGGRSRSTRLKEVSLRLQAALQTLHLPGRGGRCAGRRICVKASVKTDVCVQSVSSSSSDVKNSSFGTWGA